MGATSVRWPLLLQGGRVFYEVGVFSMRWALIQLLPFLSPLLDLDPDFLPDSYLLGPWVPFPGKKGFSWTVPLTWACVV